MKRAYQTATAGRHGNIIWSFLAAVAILFLFFLIHFRKVSNEKEYHEEQLQLQKHQLFLAIETAAEQYIDDCIEYHKAINTYKRKYSD